MTHKNGHTKQSPSDIDAEEAVLGSLLIDPDAILNISPFLQENDFFIKKNGWVYDAVKYLYEKRAPSDLVTLADELRRRGLLEEVGGVAYLTRLMNVTPMSTHAEWYGRIVEKSAIQRRLLDAAGEIAKLAHNPEIDEPNELLGKAESYLLQVLDNRTESSIKSAMDVTGRVYDHIERVHQAGGITGLPTGLTDLDTLLGGLQRSDMVVIAGRPGMGKTALATQIGKYTAQEYGKRVLIFSLEMSDEQLFQRLIAAESGIEANRLRTGKIAKDEWSRLYAAQRKISELSLDVDDSVTLTPGMMRSKAIRHHARYGIDLVIVDYLQLMNADKRGQNRHQEISEISRACKMMARELNIPVIALSQLSRSVESRAEKKPMLSDLRESGAIEADADVVMFLYRDEIYNEDTEYPGVAEIIIAKHRNGPTGIVGTFFKKQLTQFVDLATKTYRFDQID